MNQPSVPLNYIRIILDFGQLIAYFLLTKHLITQSASCIERSASSKTSLFEPRIVIVTVRPGFATPVTFITLLNPVSTSSTKPALPRTSGVK